MTMETVSGTKAHVWRQIGLISLLLLLLVGPLFGPVPSLLAERMAMETAVILLLLFFMAAFALVAAVVLRLTAKGRNWREQLRELGLGRPAPWYANLVGVLVGLVWGFLLMGSVLQFDPDTNLGQINGLRLAAAVLAALAALLEDLVGRGFIMNQLQSVQVSNWVQLLFSALLFALYHTLWGFDPFGFVFSLLYGLILGGLFLWGNRSLTPVILAHSLALLISEPFATMAIFLAAGG